MRNRKTGNHGDVLLRRNFRLAFEEYCVFFCFVLFFLILYVGNMRVSEVHAAESVAYLNSALVRLQDIWEKIGIPEEQRLERTQDVHKHIQGLLDMMIAEEEALKKRLLNSIESCRKDLNHLCSELQLPIFEEEEGCSMLQMEKNSQMRLKVMKEQKKQRMDELKDLVVKDRELCDIMCTKPFSINHESVPSLKQLETYRTYLDDLTEEKVRRHDQFASVKKEIMVCMDDLEHQPETSFETDVMCEDEEAFCLSKDNIEALKQLLRQLQQRKAKNEACSTALRNKIQELWERLKIPQEERASFSEHMVKSKKRNIEALQAELQRLELLKIQSMKSVIESIRAEISLYWMRCFYSQEQRQDFVHYQDEDFTEDLLNLHEAEVETLKSYYEDHKELFEGVTKWQENWALYLELDRKANDPSRLNNRGGNLLKEAKQRSDLHKSLPKLEKALKGQIDAWEQEHGKDFFVNGQKFLDYVQQQWEQYHVEKEKEKMERQLKKSKQTQEDMLYRTAVKTPSKRRLAGNPTPGKLRKMGPLTMSTPGTFVSSGLGATLCQSSIQKPPLSASKSLGLRTPGHSKTPRAQEGNKENLSQLNRNPPCDALRGTSQRLLNRL
ncbi:protein regulator of cytokinesis 1-like isoform X2 [Dunckerocampus dactyliophorus]|uniref:protein regulator of cytokinesis 1-like isoform X2 n=1 Tax=Dunckerocampus dactyliophorus TaxID=161453 RepID=UPI0024074985|nr:protein regulator of cytokinesis 1-like isoform X2 [Dunckerocampus dactyliophorus]